MTKKTKITKVQAVINLCKRKSGATLDVISAKLRVSKAAAQSLVNDARRNHSVKIKFLDGRYCA
jgi:DNA-binding transcriptional regulator LsrR (DeoR family)